MSINKAETNQIQIQSEGESQSNKNKGKKGEEGPEDRNTPFVQFDKWNNYKM